ncbi:MAG: DnaA N-terminal domain-containing protein [Litoreibacter sp.]
MLKINPTGPGSAARKYDLITALGAYALSLGKTDQRMVLRLITLITARYNWGRDELTVGQREIARLWSCNERTVKREMAKLRAMGWLVVKRQGARGRVTEYRIDTEHMIQSSKATWSAVGPDFVARLDGPQSDTSVVPFPHQGDVPAPDISNGTEWALAQALLHQEDPAIYGSWLGTLQRSERAGGRLTLRAPSRFHAAYVQTHLLARVLNACQSVDDTVSDILIAE